MAFLLLIQYRAILNDGKNLRPLLINPGNKTEVPEAQINHMKHCQEENWGSENDEKQRDIHAQVQTHWL